MKEKNGKLWPGFFSSLFLLFILLVILVFSPKTKPQWREIKNSSLKTQATISSQTDFAVQPTSESPAPKNSAIEATNFLILGAAGQGYDAPDLTDTILVARFVAQQNKIFLFSLPRDLLVKVPNSELWTKLNALYALNKKNNGHEFDLIKQKVQEITGLACDHYVLVDLATVKDLVDTLGGVNVMVKKDIVDPNFPGPNHSFQTFEIKAGWRFLDGETALKYIRSRHSEGGDFDRIARQQEILQAIKQKVLLLNFWDIPTFINIINTLSSRIKTDLSVWHIKSWWDEIKDIPGQNVIKTEIDKTDLVTTGSEQLGNAVASVVKPRAGIENYQDIKNYIAQIINE